MGHDGFIGRFVAEPGQRDELLVLLLEAADTLAANQACLLYVFRTRDEEPDALWSEEVWTSKAAHDLALEPEAVKGKMRRAMPLIAEMGPATELSLRGGKGI